MLYRFGNSHYARWLDAEKWWRWRSSVIPRDAIGEIGIGSPSSQADQQLACRSFGVCTAMFPALCAIGVSCLPRF